MKIGLHERSCGLKICDSLHHFLLTTVLLQNFHEVNLEPPRNPRLAKHFFNDVLSCYMYMGAMNIMKAKRIQPIVWKYH